MRRNLIVTIFALLFLLPRLGASSAIAQNLTFFSAPPAVGAGLQVANVGVRLSDSQHAGIFVSLTVNDSTLAYVARDETSAGAGTVSQFVPNGTDYAYFVVQGLENVTGSVTITASAPGFANDQTNVAIDTPQFRVQGLAAGLATIDPDDDFLVQTGRDFGSYWQVDKVRVGGPGLSVGITLSDPAVADLITTAQTGPAVTVSIPGGQSTSGAGVAAGGVAFSPQTAGVTDVTVTIPGFVGLDGGIVQVTVDPATISFSGLPMKLGAGLSSRNGALAIGLNGTAHGGTTVHLASQDSSLVLVAADNTSPGTSAVDIFVPDGSAYGIFFVHALEHVTGIGSIVASAPGFVTASDGVEVVTAVMDIKNLIGTLDALDPNDPFTVEVGIPNASGTTVFEQQPVRPGSPGANIALVSDNPAVGLLAAGAAYGDTVSVQIAPGTWSAAAAFDGVGAGSTTVFPVSDDFTPALNAFQTVVVTQPLLSILNTHSFQVGSGLQAEGIVYLSAPFHGGTTVHVAVDNPATALVSASADSVGGTSVDLFVADGNQSGIFYLQALEGIVDAFNVTVSAPGFRDTIQAYAAVTPAISIKMASYYVSTLGDEQTAITVPDEFVAEIGWASGTTSVSRQPLRAGSPGIDVTAQVSDPAIGAIVSSTGSGAAQVVRIEALQQETPVNLAAGGFAFDGLSAGPVTVSVSSPGFTPQTRAAKDLTVQAASFVTSPLADTGAGLVGAQNWWQLNGTDHGGVQVHVSVSDPAVALLAPDATTPGLAAIDIDVSDGDRYVIFQVHALEDTVGTVTVEISAPGFVSQQSTATVVTPYVGLQALPATRDVNDPPASIVARIGTPNALNGAIAVLQPRRPGGPPLVATVTSSDAAIAEILNLAGASDSLQVMFDVGAAVTPTGVVNGGLAFSGVGPGVVLTSVSLPGFAAVGTATQEITVVQNGVALLGFPGALGAGLQTEPLVARLNSSTHGGTNVRLASSDAAQALVSTGVAQSGSDTIQVFVPNGQQDATFHIQALEGAVGNVTITALVAGQVVGSRAIDIVTPGVAIASLADTLLLVDPNDEFLVQVGVPTADATGLAVTQSVRAGGLPLVCPLVLDNGVPADLVAQTMVADSLAVTIAPGAFQSAATVAGGGVALAPVTAGVVTVAAGPPGFTLTVASTRTVVIRDDLSAVGRIPAVTALRGNYPNPFNPTTTIEFSLARAGQVRLDVYDLRGLRVRRLVAENLPAGAHSVSWNGTDDRGRSQAAGVYFVRLQAPDGTLSHKVALIK